MLTIYTAALATQYGIWSVDQKLRSAAEAFLMMELPTELLIMVFGYLPKKDLKSVRLASVRFATLAAASLFDSIRLAANFRNLENARLLCQRFGQNVQTATLSPVDYYRPDGPMEKDGYANEVRKYSAKMGLPYPSDSVIDVGYSTYRRRRSESKEVLFHHEINIVLCQVLEKAPRIRSIVLTTLDPDNEVLATGQSAFAVHKGRMFEAGSGLGGSFSIIRGGASKYFHNILLTVATGPYRIANLIVAQDAPITPRAFRLSVRQSRYATNVLQSLTKLHLSVSEYYEDEKTCQKVAGFLVKAKNLEVLAFHLVEDGLGDGQMTLLDTIWRRCSFPKLNTLVLSGFEANAKDVLFFIHRLKNLKHLAFENLILTPSDCWKDVLDNLKKTCNLKSIWINNVYGGRVEGEKYDGLLYWQDYFGRMTRFFFDNGPNPFSSAELEDWHLKEPTRRSLRYGEQQNIFKEYVQDFF